MRYHLCGLLAGVSLLLGTAGTSIGGLVVNGGFETPFSTTGELPTAFGYWDYDFANSVEAVDGIVPLEGSRMLQFIATSTQNLGTFEQSDVWQLIDVSLYRPTIQAGNATASASAWFNRVAGDAQTDTGFGLELWAFAGSPDSFPTQINSFPSTSLASAGMSITTDSNLSTWENVAFDLALPTNTDFLAIRIAGLENVFNDGDSSEFDGHFADGIQVSVTAVPEPSSLVMAGFAMICYLGCRGKKLLAKSLGD